jgi:acyl dehydratase
MDSKASCLTPEILSIINTQLTGDPDHIERNDIILFAEAVRYPGRPLVLYTDEVYARRSRYGGLIAPPTYFTRLARRNGYPWSAPLPQWLADRPGLSAGLEMERLEPLRPGDTIFTRGTVADIYETDGPGGKLFYVVRDFEFTNQLGLCVGRLRRINIRFPESYPFDRPEPLFIENLKDQVKQGSKIGPRVNQITLMELNRFAAANREWGRYHMDRDFAQSLKLKDVLVIETLKAGYIANALEDCFGENAWIQKLSVSFPMMDFANDTLTCRGCITNEVVRDGRTTIDCTVWIENQRGDIGTTASAMVTIPA